KSRYKMDNTRLTVLGQDPRAVHALVIESEDDAWDLLEKLQSDDFETPDDIVFGEWAALSIYLKGGKFQSSLTPSVFPVFQKLQKEVYRTYSQCKYGYRTKSLTKEERERLEIVIHVGD